MARLMHFFGLMLRAAAVAGLVAYSNEQGLWGGHDGTARLFGRGALRLAEAVDWRLDVPPGQLPEVPVMHDLVQAAGSLWNRGVASAFDGLMLLPSALGAAGATDDKDRGQSLCGKAPGCDCCKKA